MNGQRFIIEKARQLNRKDVLHRLIGAGHDMIANDICYHKPCMKLFRATRTPTEADKTSLYDTAFNLLIKSLEVNLFIERQGFLVKSLRDKYREILRELGVKTADTYRLITFKWKLIRHFGSRVSIIDQSIGSGFICAHHQM